MNVLLILAALIVGTWNGNWFPSGRAEHRAHPDVEAATISAAAKMLAEGLRAVDPLGTNDVILSLCEIRNGEVASNLVAQIGRKGLSVASVSRYRRRDRFDQQQNVIATTLPVLSADWVRWKGEDDVVPPRGYARAILRLSPSVSAAVYSVHLKANYGSKTPESRESVRVQREISARELLSLERTTRRPVIVAGDFNTDCWRREFANEQTVQMFVDAGYGNLMSMLPKGKRGTHPHKRYGDSTLDYIIVRGLSSTSSSLIVPNDALSDHYAVFSVLSLRE